MLTCSINDNSAGFRCVRVRAYVCVFSSATCCGYCTRVQYDVSSSVAFSALWFSSPVDLNSMNFCSHSLAYCTHFLFLFFSFFFCIFPLRKLLTSLFVVIDELIHNCAVNDCTKVQCTQFTHSHLLITNIFPFFLFRSDRKKWARSNVSTIFTKFLVYLNRSMTIFT